MRKFIKQHQKEQQYEAFLHNKVEAARLSMRAGLGNSNEEVEAIFASQRADGCFVIPAKAGNHPHNGNQAKKILQK